MTKKELQDRSKRFAINVLEYLETLPKYKSLYRYYKNQLSRSATSVPANYRAACKSRSKAEYISRIGIVEEEADESLFWLDFLWEKQGKEDKQLQILIKEAGELTAIFTSTGKTAKQNSRTPT